MTYGADGSGARRSGEMPDPCKASGREVWSSARLIWNDRSTWLDPLNAWLAPHVKRRRPKRLSRGPLDLCWDDPQWGTVADRLLDAGFEWTRDRLAEAVSCSILRAYHGCKPDDAGTYLQHGVRVHDPERIAEDVRGLVRMTPNLSWMLPGLEERIAEHQRMMKDSVGKIFVCIDDREQLDHSGHYMLYGSEAVLAILGNAGHDVLRDRGVPTMLEIDLPIAWIDEGTRGALAARMLQEWTRVEMNRPDSVPSIDFGFALWRDIPPHCVVGHYHPRSLVDVHGGMVRRDVRITTCPSCAP